MKIGIIGAGASGLLLASKLSELHIDYMIFDAGKAGRKILASGNGRCNIAHSEVKKSDYLDNDFAYSLVKNEMQDVFAYFNDLHIYTKTDDEGRMYPISESSQSVLNALVKSLKTKVTELEITSVIKRNNQYYLNNGYGPFDKLVFATGSIAAFRRPYYSMDYLKNLSLDIIPFTPSLVGFTTMRKIKSMSGARAKAMATLIQDHKEIYKEYGEVMFKDNGISGIVIMNLSARYAHLSSKANCSVRLDLAYGMDYEDLTTVLQPKILEYVTENKINPHSFMIPVSGVYDFEFAQVCHGGIALDEINENLSLKKDGNIYVSGELMNVDAVCGGFNLLFAWSTALRIARELEHEISGK